MTAPLNIETDEIETSDADAEPSSSIDTLSAEVAPLKVVFVSMPDCDLVSVAELVVIETYMADILDEVLG